MPSPRCKNKKNKKKTANTTFPEAEEKKRETEKSSKDPPFLKARGGSERSPRHCIRAKDKTRKDWERKERKNKQVSKREAVRVIKLCLRANKGNPRGQNDKEKQTKEQGEEKTRHNERPPGLRCVYYIALLVYCTFIWHILPFP